VPDSSYTDLGGQTILGYTPVGPPIVAPNNKTYLLYGHRVMQTVQRCRRRSD
jgi:hypothetical protein